MVFARSCSIAVSNAGQLPTLTLTIKIPQPLLLQVQNAVSDVLMDVIDEASRMGAAANGAAATASDRAARQASVLSVSKEVQLNQVC